MVQVGLGDAVMEKSPAFVAVCLERTSVLGFTPKLIHETVHRETANGSDRKKPPGSKNPAVAEAI